MTDYNEDPLESLLDEQTDLEFGIPEIRDKFDHGASEEKHGNLKTWSAEDFSSIYVRFYPHLVRHAKRFLTNEVQAEEVVQDAFLYMMTALPEIDSELGVLKFMKWKVRLLALDVIRATPNRRETLVDSFDDEQSSEETDSEIERADDMAVIGAALAKLNPRHREALIATVYEEKSSTEVAAQMQLSENATRQLVFRARAAFKKALVGEAEVAGKSVSEVLSIAAKRAGQGAKKQATSLSIFILLAVGALFTPNVVGVIEELSVAEGTSDSDLSQPIRPMQERTDLASPRDGDRAELIENDPAIDSFESGWVEQNTAATALSDVPEKVDGVEQVTDSISLDPEMENDVEIEQEESISSPDDEQEIELITEVLRASNGETAVFERSVEPNNLTLSPGAPLEVRSASGLRAFFFVDTFTQEISNVVFRLEIDGKPVFGIPSDFGYAFSPSEKGSVITHTSSGVSFIDQFGAVRPTSSLTGATYSIQVELDEFESPISASLNVRTP